MLSILSKQRKFKMNATHSLYKKRAFALSLLLNGFCYSQAYKYDFRISNLPEDFKDQYITWVDEAAAGMLWFVTNSRLPAMMETRHSDSELFCA